MKIAVIGAKGLPATQGGIERHCEEIYSKVVALGDSVDLFARPSYNQTRWFSSYEHKGIRVICLPSLPFRGLDAFTNSAIGAIATVIRRYEIVHFHALGPALFCWLPRLFAVRSAVVVTCHGLDWQRAKWGRFSSFLIRLGEKIAVRYAHKIIVVSKDLQAYFKKNYGIEAEYIPNGPGTYTDSDAQFNYGRCLGLEPGRYILFLGRLVPEKRPDLLIKAFQRLSFSGWKLVLAGGKSDTSRYVSKLFELVQENKNVIFTGEIQGSYLSEIVRGAGLFVLPSELEGLPIVLLEAMREKIPAIASDIPPHCEILGQDRGMLFKNGDVNSLVNCLEQALSQISKLATIAERAQAYVQENYSWEKIARNSLTSYTEVALSSAVKRNLVKSNVSKTELTR